MLERPRGVIAIGSSHVGDVILRPRARALAVRFGKEPPRVDARRVDTTKHLIAPRINTRIPPDTYTTMDGPPRKRRKTSSPAQALSSPLRKPPRRPSLASPTKASLARNYPNLLPTRTPPREDVRARENPAQAFVREGAGTLPKETGDTHEEEALDTNGQDEKVKKPPLDPEIERRKQEKARLQREVDELEAQVLRCTNEIVAEQQRAADDAVLPAQRAELMYVSLFQGCRVRLLTPSQQLHCQN